MNRYLAVSSLAVFVGGPPHVAAQQAEPAPAIAPSEYAERRARVMAHLEGGVLLLQARTSEKEMEQWGFVQDPAFLYFTGLESLPMAILAMDGVSGETHVFVPPPPRSFGMAVQGVVPEAGERSARTLGFTTVRPWEEFEVWMRGRVASGVDRIYVAEPRNPVASGVPEGLGRVAGSYGLWRAALENAFPGLRIESVRNELRDMRWVKSPDEVAALRANARATASALRAAARAIQPGAAQRQVEAAVVKGCIDAGAEGPSFWPWVMSGPNAQVPRLVASFFSYHNLDRLMERGEVVRVDIGCAGGHYGGDVGRTLPVSGAFSPGQAEAWDLLVAGYRAGLEAMKPGVSLDTVRDASLAAIALEQPSLRTPAGSQAAAALLDAGRSAWHIHGVGIESGEDPGSRLEVGSVLAYEPGVQVGKDAFYLEDMILITTTGHEVLSTGLPYSAEEIAEFMRRN